MRAVFDESSELVGLFFSRELFEYLLIGRGLGVAQLLPLLIMAEQEVAYFLALGSGYACLRRLDDSGQVALIAPYAEDRFLDGEIFEELGGENTLWTALTRFVGEYQ